jgi:hypothetical protein
MPEEVKLALQNPRAFRDEEEEQDPEKGTLARLMPEHVALCVAVYQRSTKGS